MVSAKQLLDLGVVGAGISGRVLTITLGPAADPKEVMEKLLGGEMAPCRTCKALGKEISIPTTQRAYHEVTEHADLWKKGRILAEMEAEKEYLARRSQMGDRAARAGLASSSRST